MREFRYALTMLLIASVSFSSGMIVGYVLGAM
jgi:hypothetical protein